MGNRLELIRIQYTTTQTPVLLASTLVPMEVKLDLDPRISIPGDFPGLTALMSKLIVMIAPDLATDAFSISYIQSVKERYSSGVSLCYLLIQIRFDTKTTLNHFFTRCQRPGNKSSMHNRFQTHAIRYTFNETDSLVDR